MISYYKARKRDWDAHCKKTSSANTNEILKGWKTSKPAEKPEGKNEPLGKACSACWNTYKKDSSGCGGLSNNVDKMICVKAALDTWAWCIGACGTRPNDPIKLIP